MASNFIQKLSMTDFNDGIRLSPWITYIVKTMVICLTTLTKQDVFLKISFSTYSDVK